MDRKPLLEFVAVLLFLAAATAIIAGTGADLAISARYWINGGWPAGDESFWQFFYRLNRIPAFLLAGFGLFMLVLSQIRPDLPHWRRKGVFLVLVVLLGPGLMVNTVFKDHWGRPRPREVRQFGGPMEFRHPWQANIGGRGRSFPSGHAAAAFVCATPFFIYRRTNRRKAMAWLAGGTLFGIIMGAARIFQGGHFLSDILWAWGVVYLTGLALYRLLRLHRDEEKDVK